jgi:hypothetical protein
MRLRSGGGGSGREGLASLPMRSVSLLLGIRVTPDADQIRWADLESTGESVP